MRYHLDRVDPSRGPGYKLVKEFGKLLMENCSEVVGHSPLYKDGKRSPASCDRKFCVESDFENALCSHLPYCAKDHHQREGRYHIRRGPATPRLEAREIRRRDGGRFSDQQQRQRESLDLLIS